MNLSKQIEKYQQILTGFDANGDPIDIRNNRFEFIDKELSNEIISKKEVDLIAIVRSKVENVNFTDCSLEESLIFENSIIRLEFENCSLEESQFRDNTCEYMVFNKCNLSKVQFSGSSFTNTTFIDCKMNWVSLNGVVFENCDLRDIDFTGVTINNVQFKNCRITNCNSIGNYKILLMEFPTGKIGESDDLLDLILKNGLT